MGKVEFLFGRKLTIGPRQWLPVPCGGCPRRPLSHRLCLLSVFSAVGPRQWFPVPCGGCPHRPLSPRRLLLLGSRQWLPDPCGGCPRRPMSRRCHHSSRPQAPRPLWRLASPAYVSSASFFRPGWL